MPSRRSGMTPYDALNTSPFKVPSRIGSRRWLAMPVFAGAILLAAAAGGAVTAVAAPADDANTIRAFQFHAPNEALADLRRRIAATRWPDRELVTDATQGV